MLQSFAGNYSKVNDKLSLQCYKCRNKPDQQFILLLCDHLICSSCLNLFSANRQNGYNGIKCPCGVVTYFKVNPNQDRTRQRISLYSNDNHNQSSNSEAEHSVEDRTRESPHNGEREMAVNIYQTHLRRDRKSKEASSRPSVGIIQSKNTTSTKNISRINTQSYNQLQDSSQETPDYFRDKFMLQKSKYPLQPNTDHNQLRDHQQDDGPVAFNTVTVSSKKMERVQRRSANRNDQHNYLQPQSHFLPKYIQSDSAIEESIYQKQNISPNTQPTLNNQRNPKDNKIKAKQIQSQYESDGSQNQLCSLQKCNKSFSKKKRKQKDNQLAEQLKSEISYLQIQHKKLISNLQRTYKKALNKINDDFAQLQSGLKDLCLQTIVLDRDQSHVDFAKIVKLRYEGFIARNIQKLTQDIKKYTIKSSPISMIDRSFDKYQKNDGVVDLSNNTGKFRLNQMPRFSSPQPYRSTHQGTEPASIYGYDRPYHNNQQLRQNKGLVKEDNQFRVKNNQTFCFHPPAYLTSPSPAAHKLHKKAITRKTNVIIEL